MARKSVSGFKARPADFSIGAHFVWATQGWTCLMRVESHEDGKAKARVVRSGGPAMFQMKPSTSTRSIMTPADGEVVVERLGKAPAAVPDRDERLKICQAAQKTPDPFVKADALAMLAALRRAGSGFWSDDKVHYGRLKEQLIDELAVSLGVELAQIEHRVASVGIE